MSRKQKGEKHDQAKATVANDQQLPVADPASDQQQQSHEAPQAPITIEVVWLVNVKHNDKIYRAGETAEVDQNEIERLLRSNLIRQSEV